MIDFNFLICSERCGSNLITKMLNAHPDICGPSPSHCMEVFTANAYRYGNLKNDENWDVFTKDLVEYMECSQSIWRSKPTVELVQSNVRKGSFSGAIRYIHECEAKANGKKQIFLKNNHCYNYMEYIVNYYPKSKFVLLVRDPRDMAYEWRIAGPLRGGIQTAVEVWHDDQTRSLKIYGTLSEDSKVYLVKFENLLADTENTLSGICRFLGVEYSPSMLDFYRDPLLKQNAVRLRPWNDLQKPLMKDNYGFYKEKLTDTEVQFIESVCREEMDFLDYKRDFEFKDDVETLRSMLPEEDLRHDGILTKTEEEIYKIRFAKEDEIRSRRLYLTAMPT